VNTKDVIPVNDKGQWHGYCKIYKDTGELLYKGLYINGNAYGCFKHYFSDGLILENYCLKNITVSNENKEGYCFIWSKEAVDESP